MGMRSGRIWRTEERIWNLRSTRGCCKGKRDNRFQGLEQNRQDTVCFNCKRDEWHILLGHTGIARRLNVPSLWEGYNTWIARTAEKFSLVYLFFSSKSVHAFWTIIPYLASKKKKLDFLALNSHLLPQSSYCSQHEPVGSGALRL